MNVEQGNPNWVTRKVKAAAYRRGLLVAEQIEND